MRLLCEICYSIVLKMEVLCEDAGVIQGKKKEIPVNGKIIKIY
jgi:hypothetical protein